MNTVQINALLERVPKPPERPLPAGVSDADLDAFSARVGLTVPAELREWLKLCNAPCVGPGGLFGIRPAPSFLDIEEYLQRFPMWRKKEWIPIAGDGCGNYYVLLASKDLNSPVFFIDSATDRPEFVAASNLEHFLVFLLMKEIGESRWPFDRGFVMQQDPNLEEYDEVPLPWDVA